MPNSSSSGRNNLRFSCRDKRWEGKKERVRKKKTPRQKGRNGQGKGCAVLLFTYLGKMPSDAADVDKVFRECVVLQLGDDLVTELAQAQVGQHPAKK